MTEKHMRGRPTLYKDEYAEQAYNYALLGATDPELAEFFGVCLKTILNWKHDYPEFLRALNDGKVKADARVAVKLFGRAMGYDYTEVKTERGSDEEVVRVTQTTKHVAPDTTAQIFWLKNRQRGKWCNSDNPQEEVADAKSITYQVAEPVSAVKTTNAKPDTE